MSDYLRTQPGMPNVPPSSGDISGEIADAADVLESARGGIAAGMQLELDSAQTVVNAMGDATADYIQGALQEAGGVLGQIRSLASGNVNTALNSTLDTVAQIEALVETPQTPLPAAIVNGTMPLEAKSGFPAGAGAAATAPPGSFQMAGASSGGAGSQCGGTATYVPPQAPSLGIINQIQVISETVPGKVVPFTGPPDAWQVGCKYGHFFSLEPTPATIAVFTMFGGGSVYFNNFLGMAMPDSTTAVFGFEGLTFSDGSFIPMGASYNLFATTYSCPSIDAFLRQCGGAPPAQEDHITLPPVPCPPRGCFPEPPPPEPPPPEPPPPEPPPTPLGCATFYVGDSAANWQQWSVIPWGWTVPFSFRTGPPGGEHARFLGPTYFDPEGSAWIDLTCAGDVGLVVKAGFRDRSGFMTWAPLTVVMFKSNPFYLEATGAAGVDERGQGNIPIRVVIDGTICPEINGFACDVKPPPPPPPDGCCPPPVINVDCGKNGKSLGAYTNHLQWSVESVSDDDMKDFASKMGAELQRIMLLPDHASMQRRLGELFRSVNP